MDQLFSVLWFGWAALWFALGAGVSFLFGEFCRAGDEVHKR